MCDGGYGIGRGVVIRLRSMARCALSLILSQSLVQSAIRSVVDRLLQHFTLSTGRCQLYNIALDRHPSSSIFFASTPSPTRLKLDTLSLSAKAYPLLLLPCQETLLLPTNHLPKQHRLLFPIAFREKHLHTEHLCPAIVHQRLVLTMQ